MIVDHIPVVSDAARRAKLMAVLQKQFGKFGKMRDNGIHMPMQDDGKSKGFAFIEFMTAEIANSVVKQADGHRFDKNHTFSVLKFTDYEKVMATPDEYTAPAKEPFVEKEQLNSWLMDTNARDQLYILAGESASVNWNASRGGEPECVYQRENWTDAQMQWSPMGTYLTTVHK